MIRLGLNMEKSSDRLFPLFVSWLDGLGKCPWGIHVFLYEKYLIARAHFHRVPFFFLLVRRQVWVRNGLRVSNFIHTFEHSFKIPLQ